MWMRFGADNGGNCPVGDDCGFPGTRPGKLQITIPSGCGLYTGSRLLTNVGKYAAFIAATGFPFDAEAQEEVCWVWWEATGIDSAEFYYASVVKPAFGGVPSVAIRKAPSHGEFWFEGSESVTSGWSNLDGMSVNWFGQAGTSQCVGAPGPILIEIPPP